MSEARVIIDCDPGHDDALALLLASHLAEVVGVTTVSGNAPLPEVTRNAQALVELDGRSGARLCRCRASAGCGSG